jgi:pyrroline-5-carboxylate reductase
MSVSLSHDRIGFIGGGQMATAMIEGWIKAKILKGEQVNNNKNSTHKKMKIYV